MIRAIRTTIAKLQSSTSGNATMLVALGMPMLMGATGLAVDMAQWYVWKRDLQYAVDQAALAGAWASSSDDSSQAYQTRAIQEFNSNVSVVSGITSTPTVSLEDYNGGNDNSVMVRASASKVLPFSNFLTGSAATVSVFAQASFSSGESYTACLLGLGDDGTGITIGGSTTMTSRCGLAALSTGESSIVINGNPTLDPGWVISAGGIDSWLAQHTDAEIHEYFSGLTDPFASLTTPTPSPNPTQTYSCLSSTASTTGDYHSHVDTIYTYWSGNNTNNLTQITNYSSSATGYLANVTTSYPSTWTTNAVLPSTAANGEVYSDGTATYTQIVNGTRGAANTYRKQVYRTYTTYRNVVSVPATTQATLSQGTYTGGFDVSCTTVLNSGIYVINGGRLKITGQYNVTGSGVLFILKNGAYIDFAGGSNISLTAATSSQLQSIGGLSSTQANQFAGILVYEDSASQGTNNKNSINGNSSTVLNGKIYLPKSSLTFSGTATVTSSCLLLAAATITLSGNTNMSTFCPAGQNETTQVTTGQASVKLVA